MVRMMLEGFRDHGAACQRPFVEGNFFVELRRIHAFDGFDHEVITPAHEVPKRLLVGLQRFILLRIGAIGFVKSLKSITIKLVILLRK